jgi:hypothetical protein
MIKNLKFFFLFKVERIFLILNSKIKHADMHQLCFCFTVNGSLLIKNEQQLCKKQTNKQ